MAQAKRKKSRETKAKDPSPNRAKEVMKGKKEKELAKKKGGKRYG